MCTQHSSRPPGATISQAVCQERRNKPNARSHLLHGRNRPSRDRPRFLYPTPENEQLAPRSTPRSKLAVSAMPIHNW